MECGDAEDRFCNGAYYCPLISVVLGDVIDIGESNRRIYPDLISRLESELDDAPDAAPHFLTNDGVNYGHTQAQYKLKPGKSRQALTITHPNAAGIEHRQRISFCGGTARSRR